MSLTKTGSNSKLEWYWDQARFHASDALSLSNNVSRWCNTCKKWTPANITMTRACRSWEKSDMVKSDRIPCVHRKNDINMSWVRCLSSILRVVGQND